MQAKRGCPLCGNQEKGTVLYEVSMVLPEEYRLPNKSEVVSCPNCGFCYLDTDATQGDYDHYYFTCNIHTDNARKAKQRLTDYCFEEKIKCIKALISKQDKIIDIGCGQGKLLIRLHKEGYTNLQGMDMTPDSNMYLGKYNISYTVHSIFEEPPEKLKHSFDICIFTEVLEHMLLPQNAIANLKQYLKVGGKLIVTVPDMEQIGPSDPTFYLTPSIHFHHEHINYFSRKSLDRLMSRLGFKNIATQKIHIDGDIEDILLGVYENSNCEERQIYDDITKKMIEMDIAGYRRRERELLVRIKEIRTSRVPVVLWGIGARLLNMLNETEASLWNIQYMVDASKGKEGRYVSLQSGGGAETI